MIIREHARHHAAYSPVLDFRDDRGQAEPGHRDGNAPSRHSLSTATREVQWLFPGPRPDQLGMR